MRSVIIVIVMCLFYSLDRTLNIGELKKYDYIVIGGGTAGCIVASRLAENESVSVLLLEAGDEPPNYLNIPALLFIPLYTYDGWSYKSTPQTDISSIKFGSNIYTGKMLGGTAALNGAIYIRGDQNDYRRWPNGWQWNSLLPYFRKIENIGNVSIRGTGGIPITVSEADDTLTSFVNTMNAFGHKKLNVTSGSLIGASINLLTIKDGKRETPYTSYLRPSLKIRRNLIVKTQSFVENIIFDHKKRAKGVKYSKDGEVQLAYVNKEIIVTAGTISSAKLLMLSGIGPKNHLGSLNITVIADSPVGSNLRDHYGVNQVWTPKLGNILNPLFYGSATAFLNSKYNSKHSKYADIQIILVRWSTYYGGIVLLSKPESIGTVRLKSNNPRDPPIIDAKYLSSEYDLNVLTDGMKKASKIFKAIELEETIVNDCLVFNDQTDEYWRCKVKHLGSGFFHPVGTCKMGPKSRLDSVVDERLRVIGVTGLRVADASVFPNQILANPQATVMMIAERVVDFIKQDQRK